MNAAILTNEFPPEIYGGAGIHVKFLTQELAKLCHVEARCFGVQDEDKDNIRALGFSRKLGLNPHDDRFQKIFKPLDINLQWAAALDNVDVIHCHTWYSHFGGVLASRLLQCPLILTTHSLEPHRPWKAEQLGDGGYAMSCWIERTAYEAADGVIAVSQGMKRDVMKLYGVPEDRVKVIYNGIDPDFYAPTFDEKILAKWGVDPKRPFVLFVGRITRQKGISQLIQAIPQIDKSAQVVLCAGAPDTIELADECAYLEAQRLVSDEKYKEAVSLFSEIAGYKDADERCLQTKYDYCCLVAESPDDTAYAYIEDLVGADYNDSANVRSIMYTWRAKIETGLNYLVGAEQSAAIRATLFGGPPDGTTHIQFELIDLATGDIYNWTSEDLYHRGESNTASYQVSSLQESIFDKEYTVNVYNDDGDQIGSWTGVFSKDFLKD